MANSQASRVFTLVDREMQEYKNSLFWTPIVIAVGLTLVMLTSVLLVNRISIMGDAMLQVLLDEGSTSGMNITITLDDNSEDGENGLQRGTGEPQTYTVTPGVEGALSEEDWNFSREWTFSPTTPKAKSDHPDHTMESLNPILNVLHGFMIIVLTLVSINYLLGALYQDRKDRSILFWKSMPVSEWEEVLSKLGVALCVAPIIFIAASMLTQLIYVLLAMLMVVRMDLAPFELIIGHIEFGSLFFNQLSGWVLSMLWLAPLYAWLLLASAAAKRSPFMLAVAPVVGLILVEKLFIGSEYMMTAISFHLPRFVNEGGAGPYLTAPGWSTINYANMLGGLAFAAIALWGAVYLRRYRFEI